jgi:hypothetical protein
MTHNDLLAKTFIAKEIYLVEAIRAVVKLHKPYDNSEDIDGSDLRCSECGQGFEYYPCPTIQRIEKELCNV